MRTQGLMMVEPRWPALWSRIVVILALVGSFCVAVFGIKTIVVATLVSHPTEASLQRALDWSPYDAKLHSGIGFWKFVNGDTAGALKDAETATRLAPANAQFWVTLGTVCAMTNNLTCTHSAFQRAHTLAPQYPFYDRDIANVYVSIGRAEDARPFWQRAMRSERIPSEQMFEELVRVYGPDQTWRLFIADLELSIVDGYLRFLAEHNEPARALALYRERAQRDGLSRELAEPILRNLIARFDFRDAWQLWSDLQANKLIPPTGDGVANLIYNGNFEHRPLDFGFDWRVVEQPFVHASIEPRLGRKGAAAARVEITDSTEDEIEPVYQVVAVDPARRYSLSAWMLATVREPKSAMRVRVVDLECQACLSTASELAPPAQDWQHIQMSFVTGPKTRFVRVSVWRPATTTELAADSIGETRISSVRMSAIPGSEERQP